MFSLSAQENASSLQEYRDCVGREIVSFQKLVVAQLFLNQVLRAARELAT